ncbi:unnamed protein product [Strongylus vulgaris]|uniref:LIM zinc-binding domain-containing protein n=1 Tax=Strongylus vulgaris TaxID=40348 RepID=A0A3P7J1P0_STRVU|nr:unnamed protein product [Strongylus vulgaris]
MVSRCMHMPSDEYCNLYGPIYPTYTVTHKICSVCHHPILEQYFLVLESRPYHSHCLRCALCHCGLSYETSCYVKNGLVLCRKDYTAKFRRSCAKCHVTLECDDIVMRARDAVFHVQCFSCAVCGIQPNVGDIFAMTRHFEILCQVSSGPEWS